MTDPSEIIIERSPAQQAAHLNALREELKPLGYSVVSTDWLRRLNEVILKRNLEVK